MGDLLAHRGSMVTSVIVKKSITGEKKHCYVKISETKTIQYLLCFERLETRNASTLINV